MALSPVSDPKQWVARYADYLYSYAMARLDNEEEARDLVQETFLAALEKLHQFKSKSTERTWLTAILKYKVIDVYRRRNSGWQVERLDHGPEQEFFETEDGHWKEAYAPQMLGVGNADPLANKELTSILQKCMQKLPALWLSVFTMKHMDGRTTENICEELKVTSSNFWVIIHRTKLNMRACIQKEWI
ncbi:MAG TPA: sigma-70 family RNA polymerase sigma factor [Puia sp.]|jgi:RNA polymerase sigma-70 factor (ECF subfamily)